uniref:Uncharacterized protein n=1 Tax=Rhizophora mucronata TaxID=61149 RepID=A0A2P2KN13_RHIMU
MSVQSKTLAPVVSWVVKRVLSLNLQSKPIDRRAKKRKVRYHWPRVRGCSHLIVVVHKSAVEAVMIRLCFPSLVSIRFQDIIPCSLVD